MKEHSAGVYRGVLLGFVLACEASQHPTPTSKQIVAFPCGVPVVAFEQCSSEGLQQPSMGAGGTHSRQAGQEIVNLPLRSNMLCRTRNRL